MSQIISCFLATNKQRKKRKERERGRKREREVRMEGRKVGIETGGKREGSYI
jgi:hypothetical protein